jgi:predicted alpha-1,6-mannanase (GH76 family)
VDAGYVADVVNVTYHQAQLVDAQAAKAVNSHDVVESTYRLVHAGTNTSTSTSTSTSSSSQGRAAQDKRGSPDFLNNFYDDEGWWLWAFLRAFDLTRDHRYLRMAETIFRDMQGGADDVCGGGIWWSKERTYKNAIANELYLAGAAGLANRAADPGARQAYLAVALGQWRWFARSGMVNAAGTINDGLAGNCSNNGGPVWSYNQGVVLLGLVELATATGDASYLGAAADMARAAIRALADARGVLHEGCEPDCGADGSQFKGVLLRGVAALQAAAPCDEFAAFVAVNAKSVLGAAVDGQGRMGLVWSGPPSAGGAPNASTHSSALDAVLAAVSV